jgi:hypothetical protein
MPSTFTRSLLGITCGSGSSRGSSRSRGNMLCIPTNNRAAVCIFPAPACRCQHHHQLWIARETAAPAL